MLAGTDAGTGVRGHVGGTLLFSPTVHKRTRECCTYPLATYPSKGSESARKMFRSAKTGFLANRVFACVTFVIFVIFVVFRGLRSKALVFVDRVSIHHFRRFRQNPLFSVGGKDPVWLRPRFSPPEMWAHRMSSDLGGGLRQTASPSFGLSLCFSVCTGKMKVSISTVAALFSRTAMTGQRIAMVDMVVLVLPAFPYLALRWLEPGFRSEDFLFLLSGRGGGRGFLSSLL